MCCSGIVRLHATQAKGTFLPLRESYDVFVDDAFSAGSFYFQKKLTGDFPGGSHALILSLWSNGVCLMFEVLACAAPVSCDYMPPGPKALSLS